MGVLPNVLDGMMVTVQMYVDSHVETSALGEFCMQC